MVEINETGRKKGNKIKRNVDNLKDLQDILNATTFES